MDWTILGIEPTTDSNAIEKAYNEKLAYIDLENRPEEFEKLRHAYEEALKLADEERISESSNFNSDFKEFYKDFPKRIDRSSWKSFLEKKEHALGKNKTMALLLDELMERHIIPKDIWAYLEERYHFSEQKEILLGRYPANYVRDVILKGPSQNDLIPFELFRPGKNGDSCDEYLRLYYQAASSRPDQTSGIFAKMDSLDEEHPFGRALKARNAVFTGDITQIKVLEDICSEHPEYTELTLELATAYMAAGEPEKCIDICQRISQDRSDLSADILRSQAYASLGRYREASDLISSVIRDPSTETRLVGRLSAMRAEWNLPVIREYEQLEKEGKSDDYSLLDHAWRCLQNNLISDAADIAAKIDPANIDEVSYNDLMAQICFVTADYDKALRYSEKLVSIAEEADEEDKARLPEFLARYANVLYASGRKDEALSKYRESIERFPKDKNLLTMMCRILLNEKEYDEASLYARRMISASPSNYMGPFLLAQALYGLGETKAASAEADTALQLESGDLELFVLKMRLLIDGKSYLEAEQILDSLKTAGAEDVTAVKWCSALIKELKYHNDDSALDDYFDIAERIENGEYLAWAAKVYYHIATIMGAQIDHSDQEGMQRVREAVEKGLKIDPADTELLSYLDILEGKNSEGLSLSE